MCNGVQKAENLKILVGELRCLAAERRARRLREGVGGKGVWGLVLRTLIRA